MVMNFTDRNISSIQLNGVKYNLKYIPFHATEAEWEDNLLDYIPKQAEIIVYDIDSEYDYERFKIGDGEKNVNDLPFYESHLQEEIEFITETVRL